MNTGKQPNSAHCFACGLENQFGLKLKFYSQGEDTAVCNYQVAEQYQGFPGVVHGGIVSCLLDEALVRAFMAGDPNRLMYTARITVRFRHNVPTQQPLKIVGTIVKDRGRMGEAKAELFGPDGELLAEAQGLAVELPEDKFTPDAFKALGWKVYPDLE